jgi:hypothetical protein
MALTHRKGINMNERGIVRQVFQGKILSKTNILREPNPGKRFSAVREVLRDELIVEKIVLG